MKGSPILATALACLIMLGMYVGMLVAFSSDSKPPAKIATSELANTTASQISAYIEIFCSSQPESITLTHPATGSTLIKLDSIESSEWSGNISIPVSNPTSEEIEIQCQATWPSPPQGYHFIQVTITPDELDSHSHTLRAASDINDIMNFHWKESE